MACKNVIFVLLASLFFSLVAGCSGGGGPSTTHRQDAVSTEPVTLTVFQLYSKITDEDFKEFIADPVKAKNPNITMELVRGTSVDKAMEMIAAGNFPDLIFTGIGTIPTFKDMKVLADLNPLVKKYQFNLADFEPSIIDEIEKFGDNGELYAIPYLQNFSALFYNKDIFDQFGVPYPKDGMMWEDAINLGKQIADKSTGQVMSVCAANFNQFASSLALPIVDPKTEKAVLDTDAWKKAAQLYAEIRAIPGNKCAGDAKEVAAFLDGTLAMTSTNGERLAEIEQLYNQGTTLNWDIVSNPQFKDAPGKRRVMDIFITMVSSQSKHKDQAFQAIEAISTYDEQKKRTRSGSLSTFKDPELKKEFAVDLKASAGKNIKSIFLTEAAPLPPYTRYNSYAMPQLNPAVNKVINGTSDLNTAFREADDLANKAITEAKAAGK